MTSKSRKDNLKDAVLDRKLISKWILKGKAWEDKHWLRTDAGHGNKLLGSIKCRETFHHLSDYQRLKKNVRNGWMHEYVIHPHRLEDRGSKLLRNVGKVLPDNAEQQLWRQPLHTDPSLPGILNCKKMSDLYICEYLLHFSFDIYCSRMGSTPMLCSGGPGLDQSRVRLCLQKILAVFLIISRWTLEYCSLKGPIKFITLTVILLF